MIVQRLLKNRFFLSLEIGDVATHEFSVVCLNCLRPGTMVAYGMNEQQCGDCGVIFKKDRVYDVELMVFDLKMRRKSCLNDANVALAEFCGDDPREDISPIKSDLIPEMLMSFARIDEEAWVRELYQDIGEGEWANEWELGEEPMISDIV